MMNHNLFAPFYNWALGNYFLTVFRSERKSSLTFDSLKAAELAATLRTSIPSPLQSDSNLPHSPMGHILLSEIRQFNSAILDIMKSIRDGDESVLRSISAQKTPENWKNAANFSGESNLTRFISYLKNREFMLKVWLRSTLLPLPVDVRCVCNVRGLFEAFIAETAIERNWKCHEMELFVTFSMEKVHKLDCLVLENCWLFSGNFDFAKQQLIRVDKTPFLRIPQLVCHLIRDSPQSIGFKCPIFRSVPSREMSFGVDLERDCDGEVGNFVRYVWIDSSIPFSENCIGSTCIVCHFPDILT
jgi:hypothetical protein